MAHFWILPWRRSLQSTASGQTSKFEFYVAFRINHKVVWNRDYEWIRFSSLKWCHLLWSKTFNHPFKWVFKTKTFRLWFFPQDDWFYQFFKRFIRKARLSILHGARTVCWWRSIFLCIRHMEFWLYTIWVYHGLTSFLFKLFERSD